MEIVEPGKSDKMDEKPDPQEVPQAQKPEEKKPEEKPAGEVLYEGPDLKTQGWMGLRINLDAMSRHPRTVREFIGLMEESKNLGLAIMGNLAQQRAEIKSAVMKQSNKNGFRGFLNKLRMGR